MLPRPRGVILQHVAPTLLFELLSEDDVLFDMQHCNTLPFNMSYTFLDCNSPPPPCPQLAQLDMMMTSTVFILYFCWCIHARPSFGGLPPNFPHQEPFILFVSFNFEMLITMSTINTLTEYT